MRANELEKGTRMVKRVLLALTEKSPTTMDNGEVVYPLTADSILSGPIAKITALSVDNQNLGLRGLLGVDKSQAQYIRDKYDEKELKDFIQRRLNAVANDLRELDASYADKLNQLAYYTSSKPQSERYYAERLPLPGGWRPDSIKRLVLAVSALNNILENSRADRIKPLEVESELPSTEPRRKRRKPKPLQPNHGRTEKEYYEAITGINP